MEYNLAASRLKPFHHYGSTGQSGMTAKRHFEGGREPSQPIVTTFTYQEGSLGQIIFSGDCQQNLICEKTVQRNNCCRVSREPAGSKGVDLKDLSSHG